MKNYLSFLFTLFLSASIFVQCSGIAQAQLLNPATDSTLQTSDITTNNFTTTKHGFVPKGTNIGQCLKDNGNWGSCAAAGGGFDTIGTLNSLTKSTNGASSTGSSLVMQTADVTNAGLVSVGAQTFSGDKTLSILSSTVSNSTISLPIFLDETTGNFSTTKHGLVPKGTNVGNYLKDDGTWAAVTATIASGTVITSPIINGAGQATGLVASSTTFTGTNTFGGSLDFTASVSMTSGTGVNVGSGSRSPTSVSTTTVFKIFNQFAYGTWTPSFVGATSSPSSVTYTTQSGEFLKIHRFVFYNFYLTQSAVTGGGGALSVSGTPYVVDSTTNRGGGVVINKTSWTTNGPDYLYADSGKHSLQFSADGNTTNTTINVNNTGAGTQVSAMGFYLTTE